MHIATLTWFHRVGLDPAAKPVFGRTYGERR
jgi:hypothetical protein